MAYQNVGTPRFYISWGDWYRESGYNVKRRHTISPTKTNSYSVQAADGYLSLDYSAIPLNGAKDINFLAVLNHNLNPDWRFLHRRIAIGSDGQIAEQESINTNQSGVNSPIEYPGFSIIKDNLLLDTDYSEHLEERIYSGIKADEPDTYNGAIGCFVWGKYYDMPHSPNLSLTKSIDYGEVKEITTYNGSSISNTMASKSPMWGDMDAWEIYEDTSFAKLSRSGRRRWDLTFSFLDDGDLFGSNQLLNYTREDISDGVDADDIDSNQLFNFNLLDDQNFFSQVWHKTLGGTLPFIMQQDGLNFNADQFAICKFVNSSLKATQSAYHVYDISVSIEEVW